MNYFYTPSANISAHSLVLQGDEAHHIKDVLRYKIGDEIKVVDGTGFEYTAKISECSKNKIVAQIVARTKGKFEPACELTLFQGLPKFGKMELIIEKTTELGVYKIVPMITRNCIAVPKNEEAKLARWHRIAISAMKQSGGSILPRIERTIRFEDVLVGLKTFDLSLIAHQEECEMLNIGHYTLNITHKTFLKVALLIGPEGGFTKEEVESAKVVGAIPVSLSKRRLRTETAAIVGCAAILLR